MAFFFFLSENAKKTNKRLVFVSHLVVSHHGDVGGATAWAAIVNHVIVLRAGNTTRREE